MTPAATPARRRRRRGAARLRTAAAALAALLVSACAGGGGASGAGAAHTTPAPRGAPGPTIVYAALGASESLGVGSFDPVRQSWTQLFYTAALPENAVYLNLAIPGATAEEAIQRELPTAVTAHPVVATVWLNVNDILAGVDVDAYSAQLSDIVGTLRSQGAQVLVANTPVLHSLPAYRACLAGAPANLPPCVIPAGQSVPDPAALDATVAAYNQATARVASGSGAALVDLNAQGDVAVTHPNYISRDGFHPSDDGYAAIADVFEAAYRSLPAS